MPMWGTTTLNDTKLRDKLEFCMGDGRALIILGVENEIDPMLDPVLEKQVRACCELEGRPASYYLHSLAPRALQCRSTASWAMACLLKCKQFCDMRCSLPFRRLWSRARR